MLENRACEIFIEKRYKNAKLIFEKSIFDTFQISQNSIFKEA